MALAFYEKKQASTKEDGESVADGKGRRGDGF